MSTDTQTEIVEAPLLKGEGDVKVVVKTRRRHECHDCGDPATKAITYLLHDARRNPASKAYGRDDCSFCSDATQYSCDPCQRRVENDAPDGMRWCSTFSAGGRYDHLLLYWEEKEQSS